MSLARALPRRETTDRSHRRVARQAGVAGLLRVLPAGSRPAASQRGWLRAVEAHPDVAPLRADAARNLRALARELARWADWTTPTTRPTWDRLREAAGLSRATVAKWLAWLRARGLLAIVEPGSTPRFRPAVLAQPTEGNLATVYLLCQPVGHDEPGSDAEPARDAEENPDSIFLVHRTRTPPHPPTKTTRQNARARARPEPPRRGGATAHDPNPSPDGTSDGDRRPDGHETTAPKENPGTKIADTWPLWRPARTRAERLALCQRLQAESPPARAAGSARRLRHLLRPWLLAGWSARGLLHALDHTPDRGPWRYAWRSVRELRNPAGWLLHRLRAWRTPTGTPLPDPHAALATPPRPREAGSNLPVVAGPPAPPEHVHAIAAALRAQLGAHPGREGSRGDQRRQKTSRAHHEPVDPAPTRTGAPPPAGGGFALRHVVVIDDLTRLHGPTQGQVRLPRHLDWSVPAVYDLTDNHRRRLLYEKVLREAASPDDLTTWLDRDTLIRDWPQLYLPRNVRHVWQQRHPVLHARGADNTVPQP